MIWIVAKLQVRQPYFAIRTCRGGGVVFLVGRICELPVRRNAVNRHAATEFVKKLAVRKGAQPKGEVALCGFHFDFGIGIVFAQPDDDAVVAHRRS